MCYMVVRGVCVCVYVTYNIIIHFGIQFNEKPRTHDHVITFLNSIVADFLSDTKG